MTTHSETRLVPYTPAQMFELISDIERYPEFLPWCAAARIRNRQTEGETEIVDGDLIISFKVFRERFGSRVTMNPSQGKIDVSYLDGPFKRMVNSWTFRQAPENQCELNFFVDFEFKSRTLQALIGVVFEQAMHQVVRAFETRAAALYGPKAAE